MLPYTGAVVVALVHCVPDTPNNKCNNSNNNYNNYTNNSHNNNIRSRSCLATIANFYMVAQLKIVCAVLFFTHLFCLFFFFLFTLLMALLFLVACCKLQFPVA